MAINIQEILHPSDSNQIKWEKVNYNFDQILANGGGPTGQKGTKGIQGSVGQTGAKGNKGDQGIKGETGATSSRWKVIPRDQDGNGVNEYVILKPKLENDAYHPVIFLGDQTFDNVNGNDGEIQLRSTLTIGKHAVGGASSSTELLTLWHGPHATTNNNVAITISTDDSGESQYDPNIYSGNWTRFTLDETWGSSQSGDEKIEFKIGMDRVVFDTNVSFDDNDSTLKLPETQKANDELELGMIRFFGGNFWGYKEDANGNALWTQFCMAPCGSGGSTGTIEFEDGSNISVGPDGALLGNTIEIVGGDLDIDVNGDPWNGAATTTAAPDYTLTLNGGANLTGLSATAGGMEIPYTTGPTGNLLLSDAEFTAPSWVKFYSSDGLAIDVTIFTNTSTSGRSGTITIKHPNDPNVTAAITIAQAGQVVTTNTPTYTTKWTVNETVSNATVHVTDSTTSSVDNTDTRVAEAGVTVNRAFYFRPAEGHAFQSASDITVIASQGTATIDSSITSLGNIKVNVSHVTNTTNNSITVTASGSAQSTAVEYTQLLASPSPVDEGTDITVTMNGNNIPDGTQVYIEFTGTNITLQSDFIEQDANFDSGEGSGTPYGGTGGGFGAGIYLTFSGNTASAVIGVEEDGATEGAETVTLTAYPTDSADNATGSLNTTVDINDTSTAPTQATVTYSISDKSSQWEACNQSSNAPRSTTYQTPSTGLATWSTVRAAIRAHAGNLIQSGTWYKIISSTEPGFTFDNHIINSAVDSSFTYATDCSNVTTTTTTTTNGPNGNTWVYTSYSYTQAVVNYFELDSSGQVTAHTTSPVGGGSGSSGLGNVGGTICSLSVENGAPENPYWTNLSGTRISQASNASLTMTAANSCRV